MPTNMPVAGFNEREVNDARRREEAESTLTAIASAIANGRLSPDEAFAWARIAACEVKALPDYPRPITVSVADADRRT